jgi:hypothetical protein
VDVGESPLIKYTVARCATHFPLACEAIQVPGQGFHYLCAGDHMIARQLVLRIRQKASVESGKWIGKMLSAHK